MVMKASPRNVRQPNQTGAHLITNWLLQPELTQGLTALFALNFNERLKVYEARISTLEAEIKRLKEAQPTQSNRSAQPTQTDRPTRSAKKSLSSPPSPARSAKPAKSVKSTKSATHTFTHEKDLSI